MKRQIFLSLALLSLALGCSGCWMLYNSKFEIDEELHEWWRWKDRRMMMAESRAGRRIEKIIDRLLKESDTIYVYTIWPEDALYPSTCAFYWGKSHLHIHSWKTNGFVQHQTIPVSELPRQEWDNLSTYVNPDTTIPFSIMGASQRVYQGQEDEFDVYIKNHEPLYGYICVDPLLDDNFQKDSFITFLQHVFTYIQAKYPLTSSIRKERIQYIPYLAYF